MLKKQVILLFALVLTFPLAAVFAQKAAAPAKEARWEGRVERSSKEQSSLTVRNHADKKINDIDASQVKDGDYVICKGTAEKAGEIHATLISKRLSHSQ